METADDVKKRDPWVVWRALVGGHQVDLHEGEVHFGYYQMKVRGHDELWALAIYPDTFNGDRLTAQIYRPGEVQNVDDGIVYTSPADDEKIWRAFSNGCKRAVAHKVWQERATTGKWPHIADAVHEVAARTRQADDDVRRGIGANDPPDEYALKLENLATLMDEAKRVKVVEDDEAEKRALSLVESIAKIRLWGDKTHKAEKEPHLAAGKAVDERFRWRNDAAAAEAAVKRVIEARRTAMLRAQREREEAERRAAAEARRKAEEEERAERQRLAELAKAGDAKALDDLVNRATAPAPAVPEPEVAAEPAGPAQIATGLGRKANVAVKVVVKLVDVDEACAALADEEELHAVLVKIAQRRVDNGGRLPAGFATDEVAKVRR